MSLKVLTVVGARPQFVKAAPVSRALRERHDEVLVHTGQHYDDALSGSFFRDLGLPAPDVRLGVGSGAAGPRLAAMIGGVRNAIRSHAPDVVVVYGDTDTTLAGALAARSERVPLAHVEAGLRSGRLDMPEEINRIATDHLAALLLCPTEHARQRLIDERARGSAVFTGDVMLDALMSVEDRVRASEPWREHGLARGAYAVATVHRVANADDPVRLGVILDALSALGMPVVLPCHPRTRAAALALGERDRGDLRIVDPVGYLDMLALVAGAAGVLTDSGGLQKEAAFLGVPCATLREETEWPETLDGGANRLVGADPGAIGAFGAEIRASPEVSTAVRAVFGAGAAAEAVVRALETL